MMDDTRHAERELRRQELEQRRHERELRRQERRRQRGAERENPWTRLVVGLAILGVGVVAWLDRLGRIDGNDFLAWWALILIGLGLANLPQRRWVAAGVWLALGRRLHPQRLRSTRLSSWRSKWLVHVGPAPRSRVASGLMCS